MSSIPTAQEVDRLPKWAADGCQALREIGVLLVALAPLDGTLEGQKGITDLAIWVFAAFGVFAYAVGAIAEAISVKMLRDRRVLGGAENVRD